MTTPVRQPNVILITTDQQRFDTTSPWAPPWLRTPHLDHLQREGVTFTRGYADCPVCVPSRTSIMTGCQGFTHGMTSNGTLPDGTLPIDRDRSLPTRMRRLGYQTIAVGKMHFMPQRARYGFEEMILPDDYYREMSRFSWFSGVGHPMQHGLGQNELYPGMATVPESYTLTAWIVDQCVEFIKRRRDPQQPFFMWCSFSKPHPPLDPPEPYYSMYRRHIDHPTEPIGEPWLSDWSADDSGRCPEAFRSSRRRNSYDLVPREILREARSAYYGLITQIDYNVGRLFAALQDHDIFNDTAILYTSDHGEFLGDHHAGAKGTFYEGSAHVPFILRLPPTFKDRPVGLQSASPVCLADVYTTCIAAAGGSVSEGGAKQTDAIDGHDLIALSTGRAPGREWLEAAGGRPKLAWYGLTDGRWKYHYYFGDGREQLFDLHADPHELADLASESEDSGHRVQLDACRSVLTERLVQRNSPYIRDGRLAVTGLPDESDEAEHRAHAWPGYHTTEYHVDVRH
jgi:arylsulfatase